MGVGIKADSEKLQVNYRLGFNASSADLWEIAANACGRTKLRNYGLKELARVELGKDVEKPQTVKMSR